MADVDNWIDIAKQCKYLPENDLKVTIFMLFILPIIEHSQWHTQTEEDKKVMLILRILLNWCQIPKSR